MKLNLGAGNDILKGYINHDLVFHSDKIDIVFDLEEKHWEVCVLFEKNINKDFLIELDSLDEIRAFDVIEHISNPVNFMDNCWKLLKPDGILYLKACGWQNPNFWVDITHKKGYDIKSFDYFDPSTELGQDYGYYTDKRWQIQADYPHYDRRKNIIIKLKPIK